MRCPCPLPAAGVHRSHRHAGEGPSHGHLPLLLRQCSEWGLWDNDLPNKGGGVSFAGIAAQFRLPDAIGPPCSVTCLLALGELSFACRDPLCCHKCIPRDKHGHRGDGSDRPESSICPSHRKSRRLLCPLKEHPGIVIYIRSSGTFVTASGLLQSEEELEIGLF